MLFMAPPFQYCFAQIYISCRMLNYIATHVAILRKCFEYPAIPLSAMNLSKHISFVDLEFYWFPQKPPFKIIISAKIFPVTH